MAEIPEVIKKVPETLKALVEKGKAVIRKLEGIPTKDIYVIDTDVFDGLVIGKDVLVAVPKGRYDIYYITKVLGAVSAKKLGEVVPTTI